MRTTRKVNHDATIQVGKVLYETDQRLCGIRAEVRFDPEWLSNTTQSLLLFIDGVKVGEARYVNFRENAYVRRRRSSKPAPKNERGEDGDGKNALGELKYSASINFSEMMRGE